MAPTLTELVLDRAQNAVIWLDEGGLVTYWNPSAEQMFGIARDQALGHSVAELIIPERLRAAHQAGIERFLLDGTGPVLDQRVEMTALRSDRTEFPVELTISALKQDAGWLFSAFVQDASSRVEAEHERERLVRELRRALHGSERRFDAIIGALSDPVTIRDRENRLVYANAAALAYLELDSVEELRSTSPDDIFSAYRVLGEGGQEISMADIPSVRILGGRTAEPLLIRTIDRRSGVERWNLLKAAPLVGTDGEVEGTITVIEDVTEHKRAEQHAVLLARAGEVLASSLDYELTLRNVAALAVPDLVDWCAVDLIDETGDRVPVAVAHVDPARLALAAELRKHAPARLNPDQGLGHVLSAGASALYPEITDEMLRHNAVDQRHLELLRSVGMRSVVLVPMRLGSRILGAMTLVSAESARVLDQSDVAIAEQIAARAAVAIENSRLYSERSRIAHTLQQSLVPARLPEIPGYELASAYLPAVADTEAGGDFYDVWKVDDGWMITIGDVTGKGVEAAALTAVVRYTMRAMSEFVSSPAELLARLDGALKRNGSPSACTALCVRLAGDQVTVASGGHPLPLRLTAGEVRSVGEHGPLLGALDDVEWRESVVRFVPGSTLVLYTDGVTDAVGDGGRFGTERLLGTLGSLRTGSAVAIVDGLLAALAGFQVGANADDVAVLALRYPTPVADGATPVGARGDAIIPARP
ncbi:MAG: SpoIIE family protein phosphatase [Actinomycetota bacterium]|nr:SpoIIE family protein phosphatase [Actinomycetota bacterium]